MLLVYIKLMNAYATIPSPSTELGFKVYHHFSS